MLKNGGGGHQEPQKESPIMRLPLSTRISVRFPMHSEWSRDWRVADSPSLIAVYRRSRHSAWRLLPALPRPHHVAKGEQKLCLALFQSFRQITRRVIDVGKAFQ